MMGKRKVLGRKAVASPTLTVEQAGDELGISRNSAYEAAKRGDIPTIRIGRRILVPRLALERMLAGEGLPPREVKAG